MKPAPREGGCEQGDDTLDLVRLLVETETRHAQTKSQPSEEEAPAPRKKVAQDPNIALSSLPLDHEQTEARDAAERARRASAAPMFEGLAAKLLGRHADKLPPREDMMQYLKLVGLMSVASILLFKPWILPLILFVLIWLSLILFLLLGSARIGELININWIRYERKRPEKAERLLGMFQRTADRTDGFLARLPEKWVDGIYTPDLGRSKRDQNEERLRELKGDPFDRLVKEREAHTAD